eukprot:4497889-Heterocapsa_arctica.AAC.1
MSRASPDSGVWTVVGGKRQRKRAHGPLDNKRSEGQIQPRTTERTPNRGGRASGGQKGDHKTPTSGAHAHRAGR